jgi:hypothetical protein
MDLEPLQGAKRMKVEKVETEFKCITISFDRLANYLSMTSGEERPANPLSILREDYKELRKAGVKKGAYLAHCSRMLTLSGFGGGGVTFFREDTANSPPIGKHIGGTNQSQGTPGVHTDESQPLEGMIDELNNFLSGDEVERYQQARHYLHSLAAATRNLYDKNLSTNQFTFLSIVKYRDWLIWVKRLVDIRPQSKIYSDFEKKLDVKRGKVDWPEDLTSPERFEEYSKHCGDGSIIVLTTPPASMVPGLNHGVPHLIVQRWLYSQAHAGPPKNTGKRPTRFEKKYLKGATNKRYRITAFDTNPSESGFLGVPKEEVYNDFRNLQETVDAVIISNAEKGVLAVRQALLSVSPTLEQRYPRNIMDGTSHKYFTSRVIGLAASQRTVEEMRATLWQYNEREVPQDFDPARDIPLAKDYKVQEDENNYVFTPNTVSNFRIFPLSKEARRNFETM